MTNKNSWGPNTLIKQGAKLVATWEDLPAEVRLALTPTASPESSASSSASLFPDEGLPPHEKRILGLLKADESTHIDEIVEKLETELSSSGEGSQAHFGGLQNHSGVSQRRALRAYKPGASGVFLDCG